MARSEAREPDEDDDVDDLSDLDEVEVFGTPLVVLARQDHVWAAQLIVEVAEHPGEVTDAMVATMEAATARLECVQLAALQDLTRAAARLGHGDWFQRMSVDDVAHLADDEVETGDLTAALEALRLSVVGGQGLGERIPEEVPTLLLEHSERNYELLVAIIRVAICAFPEMRETDTIANMRAYIAGRD